MVVVDLLIELFSSVREGIISTLEAQKCLHSLCSRMHVNPAFEMPMNILRMTKNGQERVEKYEEFITTAGWTLAKVAAFDLSIEEAAREIREKMEKLRGSEKKSLCEESPKECPCCGEMLERERRSYG